MNKGIYRIAAGVGAAVILVSSATAQAATVTANGTPAPVASDSIAGWPDSVLRWSCPQNRQLLLSRQKPQF